MPAEQEQKASEKCQGSQQLPPSSETRGQLLAPGLTLHLGAQLLQVLLGHVGKPAVGPEIALPCNKSHGEPRESHAREVLPQKGACKARTHLGRTEPSPSLPPGRTHTLQAPPSSLARYFQLRTHLFAGTCGTVSCSAPLAGWQRHLGERKDKPRDRVSPPATPLLVPSWFHAGWLTKGEIF